MSEASYTENDESCEEEIEPKLKYIRLRNDLESILLKDAASCIAIHPKFICLGSNWGVIYLLDHQGNLIEGKELRAHQVAVNQISIDIKGDSIATCSDDGKIFIHELYNPEKNQLITIGRLIKTISLDPNYFNPSSGRRFIVGDDKLTLYEKSFLGRLRTTTLCESEGYVRSLCWGENFIAWTSDIGVRVYDINARCSLGLIKWEENARASLTKFRCNLRWSDARTLLIAWVDTVRVCVIRKRTANEFTNHNLPEYLVDPISTFRTEFYLSGIAPLDHQLVLLGFPKEHDDEQKAQRPQLYIVEYRDNDYVEVCTDCLTLRGYKEYGVNDYHLDVLGEESRFFIVAPKDVVIASLYDLDDRIQWLIAHNKYEEALEVLMQQQNAHNLLVKHKYTLIDVGIAYLDYLLAHNLFQNAGKLCAKIFGNNKQLWQDEIYKFAAVHQLRAVSAYIPRTLDKHIYEMILYEYLKMDGRGFLTLVKEWEPHLYNTQAVTNAVLEHLLVSDVDKEVYLEALALLYSFDGQYEKSVAMFLVLKNKDVFTLIQTKNLYSVVEDKIVDLMNLDQEKTIALLLEKNRIPSEIVIKKLANHEMLLYKYLHAYDKVDTKKQYHGILVKLYAIFDRDKLLPLLKRSENYPIQEALDICEKAKYYPEMVFLLARIGDLKEALELIMQQLKDMPYAIQFCQEQNDPDLWRDLIEHSLDRPEFVTFLLQSLGTWMDPTILVEQIKEGMVLPGLKGALVKMLCMYNLQVSVHEGCKKILVADYFNLHKNLVKMQMKGVQVSDEMVCGACHRRILQKDASTNCIIVYNCKHSFHEQCLPEDLSEFSKCGICYETTTTY